MLESVAFSVLFIGPDSDVTVNGIPTRLRLGRIHCSKARNFNGLVYQRVCGEGRELLYCFSQKSKSRSGFS